MPIIKSAIKRARQQAKRRSHNIAVKRAVRLDIRSFMEAIEKGDAKAVTETFRAAVSEIDRAVKKGTLHRNTAARRKSQLSQLAKTQPAKPTKAPAKAKPAAAKK
jgi:small subunit ribosomal protein S20